MAQGPDVPDAASSRQQLLQTLNKLTPGHVPCDSLGCGPWQGACLYPLNERAATNSERRYSEITNSNKHLFLLCDTGRG